MLQTAFQAFREGAGKWGGEQEKASQSIQDGAEAGGNTHPPPIGDSEQSEVEAELEGLPLACTHFLSGFGGNEFKHESE